MGLAPSEFWALSLPEITQQLEGAAERRRWWRELGMWVAWHVAAFSRQQTLPELEPILRSLRRGGKPESKAEKVDQHRRAIMALSARYQIPMVMKGRKVQIASVEEGT